MATVRVLLEMNVPITSDTMSVVSLVMISVLLNIQMISGGGNPVATQVRFNSVPSGNLASSGGVVITGRTTAKQKGLRILTALVL